MTELVLELGIDICFVTETWMKLSDTAKMAEIHEKGLECFNAPRQGKGGGVAFLFNPRKVHLVRNNVSKFSSFEVLETLLETSTTTIRLCVVYRSTQLSSKKKYDETKLTKFFEDFDNYLDLLENKSGRPLICGDFNFHVESESDPSAKQFITLFTDRGFKQHVTAPTHISGGTLDLVLTRSLDADYIDISELQVTTTTGTTSDHYLVSFEVPLQPVKHTSSQQRIEKDVRELSQIQLDLFKKGIESEMPDPTTMLDLDDAVSTYDSILTRLLDKHAPSKTIRVKENESPWWNGACKEARKERRKAERLHKKNRSMQQ